ncbi:MAG: flagellar hook-basal body protein [Lachnospirales bacterium]
MNRGLYIGAVGMTTQMSKMDAVSNNIANVNTTGFKKDGVVTRTFDDEIMYRLGEKRPIHSIFDKNNIGNMDLGLSVDQIYTDFTNGSFEKTEDKYNIAIDGDGFIKINYVNKNGETSTKYTRNGALTIDAQGTLITNTGYVVQGQNGNIILPKGDIAINEFGNIYVDGEFIDAIALTSFEDNGYLKKYGENFYDIDEGGKEIAFAGSIVQGYIETSNVNSAKEMVEMINLSRAYEASQKVISAQDTIMGMAASRIGSRS